jgi:hypothetical protein
MPYSEDALREGLAYDEDEIKYILRAEREASVGFDYDADLNGEREQALNYFKGIMPDMPAGENRSKVVSTDVADAIEQALPDLIDIFLAGEDGMTFQATGAEDEDLAKQETDYVRHVVFQQNRGFGLLYTGIKDALLLKIGVWKFYWDGEPEFQEYETTVDEMGLQELEQLGVEVIGIEPGQPMMGEQGPIETFNVTARKMVRNGKVCINAIPPEDFTVSSDTVVLGETPYCAYRRRVRVQELLADGYDPEKVSTLRADETSGAEIVGQARDLAHEREDLELHNAAIEELRLVEVIEHYIRLDLEGTGRPQIWRIVTGNNEECILEMEKRARIEFAAITPYPQTHRFYGMSLADKQMEIQRVKTALNRMLLDSGYFAQNQRPEVDMSKALPETIPALLDNQPGRPVPVKMAGAVNPIQTAPVSFDILAALEYTNTSAELRSGVMRHTQGIDPDSLHDTKGGAQIQMNASQKRMRLMARQFAEGGVRDLFLGVHDLLRSNATIADTIRLRNTWVQVDPSAWSRRKDVTIDIGIGSGGREEKLLKLNLFSERIAQLVELQGGLKGPLVTAQNVYALVDMFAGALDIKSPERFVTDPSQQDPNAGGEEEPSPEMLKVQGEMEMAKAKLEMQAAEAKQKMELAQVQAEFDAKMQVAKIEAEQNALRDRAALEAELARDKAVAELELAREKMANEMILARERQAMEAEIGAFKATAEAETKAVMSTNRPGGSLAE